MNYIRLINFEIIVLNKKIINKNYVIFIFLFKKKKWIEFNHKIEKNSYLSKNKIEKNLDKIIIDFPTKKLLFLKKVVLVNVCFIEINIIKWINHSYNYIFIYS